MMVRRPDRQTWVLERLACCHCAVSRQPCRSSAFGGGGVAWVGLWLRHSLPGECGRHMGEAGQPFMSVRDAGLCVSLMPA